MRTSGLDGVVAAETVLSHVDGEAGRLILRGHELRELVRGGATFEQAAALLWQDFAVEGGDAARILAGLGAARLRAHELVATLLDACGPELGPVEGLRVGLGLLADAEAMPHHLLVCGALPVFAAALLRRAEGLAPLRPDPALGTAADFLRLLRGAPAPASEVRALDAYLVTIADHGMNASTFAARVVASTRAGLISAALAGLCALKGPLHGGAPGPVLDMLDAIGDAARIAPWLAAEIAAGRRLMGFGHRIYRVRDPRADVLKEVVASLRGASNRIAFAEEVERAALALLAERQPGRRLDTNVEFYTALLLEALAIPRAAFTAIFAIGRAAGWCAHILEQERGGRIIRPLSAYVGPEPGPRHAA
ncbi:MAG: citrate synthase/methylcitrate synthase [Alphaproteobacteria bacterium]|nr:citrate synthase/methylcitrate synthase [Alphaproteobacteria bacterium]